MGKKNKKKDIWDLTPEEQKKQADEIFAFEKGNIDILSISNVEKCLNDNGFSAGLEAVIAKDLRKQISSDCYDNTEPMRTNMEEILNIETVTIKDDNNDSKLTFVKADSDTFIRKPVVKEEREIHIARYGNSCRTRGIPSRRKRRLQGGGLPLEAG